MKLHFDFTACFTRERWHHALTWPEFAAERFPRCWFISVTFL